MTVLVAVKKNGRVFLGADRITTFGNEYHTDLVGGQKIMKLKNAYLATSGYTLLDNVLEHLVATNHKMMDNPFRTRSDVFSFFLELYSELRKSYTLVDTGKDTYAGVYNVFFIVTPKSIFGISNNLSVSEYPQYAAKGAGADYSLGALYSVYDSVHDGYELVRLALEAACHFSVYCREPLDIIEVSEADFKAASKGYKALGKGLRTLPKRKTPGSLLPLMKNGKDKSATTITVTRRETPAKVKSGRNGKAGKAQPAKRRPR
jgi:ATP-dependent protease HslVU (ClpYQ) peptidase subunit